MAEEKEAYNADSIKVLDGLEGVRKSFDLIEISKKVIRKGDILILSKELHIRPRILHEAVDEARIKGLIPHIEKSKASILARLRTNREVLLFSQKYDLKHTSARKLIKIVREWNSEIQKNPLVLVSPEEHDLIIGSLLGDASIRQREKNSCFRFTHSMKQKDYAKFKKEILKNFNLSEFREVQRRIKHNFIHAIDFSTKTHAVFNYYRKLFYKDNKKIVTSEILNQLNPRSLMFWICDDGSYDNKQGYIVLCTNDYSLEEHKLMKVFFKEKFGLEPTIGFRDHKYYFLRFKQEDSRKLISIIKPFIHESMTYKIGERKND
jgi:hypothetical protein